MATRIPTCLLYFQHLLDKLDKKKKKKKTHDFKCTVPPDFVIPHGLSTLYRCLLTTMAQNKPYHEKQLNRDCCNHKGSCTLFRPYSTIAARISSSSFIQVCMRQLAVSSLSKGISSTQVSCLTSLVSTHAQQPWDCKIMISMSTSTETEYIVQSFNFLVNVYKTISQKEISFTFNLLLYQKAEIMQWWRVNQFHPTSGWGWYPKLGLRDPYHKVLSKLD